MVLDGKPAIRSKMEGAGRHAAAGGYQQERPRRAGSGRENHRMNAEEFVTVVKLHERRSRQRYFEGPGAPAWEVPVRKTSATVTLVQPICQRQTKRCLEPPGQYAIFGFFCILDGGLTRVTWNCNLRRVRNEPCSMTGITKIWVTGSMLFASNNTDARHHKSVSCG